MYCKNCGAQLDDRAVVCPQCGVPTGVSAGDRPPEQPAQQPYQAQQQPYQPYYPSQQSMAEPETGSTFGWGVLGFFFPIVGLILFLVWKAQYPRRAKASGIGALVGVIVQFVFGFLYGIILAAALANNPNLYALSFGLLSLFL